MLHGRRGADSLGIRAVGNRWHAHWIDTMRTHAAACLIGMTLASLAVAAAPPQYFGAAPAAAGTAPPFSEAVLVGDTLYVAGHVGIDPKTQQAVAGAELEAHAVLDAVQHTIEAAGMTMDDLVSVTVYCTDLQLYDAFNAVYRGYFHGHFPTRAFIGVDKLVRGAHFEVAGIAAKPR
jgi:reactive intermediate/imine deaminase